MRMIRLVTRLVNRQRATVQRLGLAEAVCGLKQVRDLAGLLYRTNRLSEAEPLYRRALTIFEKSLGEVHPNVASVRGNLTALTVKAFLRRLFRMPR